LISLPCDPIDPDPWEVFDELRPPNQEEDLLTGRLHRWDPCRQGYRTWHSFIPSDFGGPLRVGEGYWLWLDDDITISYQACCGYRERSITFPCGANWYMIGHPQNDIVLIYDCEAELDGDRIRYCDAVPGWIGDPLVGYDPAGSGYYYVTCGDLYPDRELIPFQGYWIDVKEADLTIYVPPPPFPP